MVIESKYGITLTRLTIEDIELVRKWRNSPEISKYMEFRDYISKNMQEKWFNSLDNKTSYFFIPIYKSEKIGLVDIKNIDWHEKTGEAGIFISNLQLQNTHIPFAANLAVFDFDFYELGLKTITAHIVRSNARAIKFNKAFGFKLQKNQNAINNQLYHLDINEYEEKTKKIKKTIIRLMKG